MRLRAEVKDEANEYFRQKCAQIDKVYPEPPKEIQMALMREKERNDYYRMFIRMAEEKVEARIKSYADAFRKESIIPNGDDLEEISQELEGIIEHLTPNIPTDIARILNYEAKKIIGDARRDLRVLIQEMQLEQKESSTQNRNNDMEILQLQSLLKNVNLLKEIMIDVSTGKARIDDRQEEYNVLYEEIENNIFKLQQEGSTIYNPNNFRSLWEWLGYWKSEKLTSYQSRRQFVIKLYEEVIISIQNALKELKNEGTILENQRQYNNSLPQSQITPPIGIQESLIRFREDYPDSNKAAFIMMKFSRTKAHEEIFNSIRDTLSPFSINALRADDKEYHDDLFPNILTYIYGCGFGIAVFERIEAEEFNPNVSLEVGYMFALKKPVCLLKDRTLKTLHTDLVGKLYRPFDAQDISQTIKIELSKWLADKNLTGDTNGKRKSGNELVDEYSEDKSAKTRFGDFDAELNMTNLLEYLPDKISNVEGFHIDPKNPIDYLPEVIRSLWRFGIHKLSDLDKIMTEEYFAALVKHQVYPTYVSLLEDAMIFHDIDRYFESAHRGWDIASFGTVDISKEKYGDEKVEELFKKYGIISDYDLL